MVSSVKVSETLASFLLLALFPVPNIFSSPSFMFVSFFSEEAAFLSLCASEKTLIQRADFLDFYPRLSRFGIQSSYLISY